MLRTLVISMAVLAVAQPVRAQGPQPADPGQARASAEAMIKKAGAGDLFEPGAWPMGPAVRHKASGLTCRFFGDGRDQLVVVPMFAPRGQDVFCSIGADVMLISLYATTSKLTGGHAKAADGTAEAMKNTFENLRAYDGPSPDDAFEGWPPRTVHKFVGDRNGQPWFTRVATFERNGWTYKQRVSAPASVAAAADQAAAIAFASLARDAGVTMRAARSAATSAAP